MPENKRYKIEVSLNKNYTVYVALDNAANYLSNVNDETRAENLLLLFRSNFDILITPYPSVISYNLGKYTVDFPSEEDYSLFLLKWA